MKLLCPLLLVLVLSVGFSLSINIARRGSVRHTSIQSVHHHRGRPIGGGHSVRHVHIRRTRIHRSASTPVISEQQTTQLLQNEQNFIESHVKETLTTETPDIFTTELPITTISQLSNDNESIRTNASQTKSENKQVALDDDGHHTISAAEQRIQTLARSPVEAIAPTDLSRVSRFTCKGRNYGLFADVRSECRAFIECIPIPSRHRHQVGIHFQSNVFMCPPRTAFDQRVLTCVPIENSLPCHLSPRYYLGTEEMFAVSSQPRCTCK